MSISPSRLQLRSWKRAHLTSVLIAITILCLVWSFRKASFPDLDFRTNRHGSMNIHPIHQRFLVANATYTQLLDRQSKTIGQARKEYKKRYKMEPPKGFDRWFQYAQKHQSLIIDDFDEIHERLQPFRQHFKSGCDSQQHDKFTLQDQRLIQVCIRDGKIKYTGIDDNDFGLTNVFEDFLEFIPDICFLLNTLDEPRVLLPSDKLIPTWEPKTNNTFCPKPSFINYAQQNWWSEAVLSCPPNSPAKMYPGKPDHSRDGKLLGDWKTSTDLCSYSAPIEHGMIMSPSTLMVSHDAIPILSNAGLSTNNDIFFPSMWRFDLYDEYTEEQDIPWEKKKSTGYWRGSTTGGHALSHNWEKFQRHRFVDLAADPTNPVADKMDVGFSNVVQCSDDACNEQRQHFTIAQKDGFDKTWKSKIVFDVDGNGLSGRFYPLLRSNSAVLRQGIFREWHDSRIQPWLHYVPMSMELTEVKDMLAYLLGPGESVLKNVAYAGKVMANSSLRREDMKIYFYRLLIEMARR